MVYTEFRAGRTINFALRVQLTFWPLDRGVRFDRDATERLRTYFTGAIASRDFDSRLVELSIEGGEVTLLVEYPPKHSVAGLVDSLKGVSSRLLQEARPDLKQLQGAFWSPSYNAISKEGM